MLVSPNSIAKLNSPPFCQTATASGPSAAWVDPISFRPTVSAPGLAKKMSPDESW
ncbi:MAG TPA: hypothetical protein VEF71_03990 [Streptosporangiaceae bacterium]|nr:hypothetical protein [Streptosporangiaceae bacterium]